MYSSMNAACGCSHAYAYGKLIGYARCIEHYKPEDDALILEAATHARELVRQMQSEQEAG